MSGAGLPREAVEVVPAPQALQPLVECAIWRQADIPPDAVLPAPIHANGYACLNVLLSGSIRVDRLGTGPRRFVTGPFTQPLLTLCEGRLASLSIVLQPWLLRDLFGVEPSSVVDTLVNLDGATGTVAQLLDAVEAAAADPAQAEACWQAFARSIPSHSRNVPAELALQTVIDEGADAAARQRGLSLRHYRRRFVAAMGLTPKAWLRTKRFEQALGQFVAPAGEPLAQVAQQGGFADQAHMAREFRSIALRSPSDVREGLHSGAAGLWAMQAIRVLFVQDTQEAAAYPARHDANPAPRKSFR